MIGLLVLAGCGGDGTAASVAIENVTLIDGTDRGPQPNMTVVVRDDRVVAVGRAAKVKLGQVATRINGKGMFLIPGLWDMHVHLFAYQERSFPLFLANGVTTIREVGGDLERSGYFRQEIRFGRLLGPDLLIAGPILDGQEIASAAPQDRLAVRSPAAAERLVDSLSDRGVDLVKVHSQIPPAAYFAILDRAKERRLLVTGHIPDGVTARQAIDSGHRIVEHDWGLALANSSRQAELMQWMLAGMNRYLTTAGKRFKVGPYVQFRLDAGDSALASHDATIAREFATHAASRDVWFDPTLIVLKTQFLKNEPGSRDLPELRFAPRVAREFEDGPPRKTNPTAADVAYGKARWAQSLAQFRELVRAKAKFVAGTDVPVMPLVPGFSLHRELELLVEMGLTPLEAIQAGTRNAARAMLKDDRGTIEVDRRADLVLLSADPLAKIGNTRSIQMVMVGGRLLDRATLDRFLQEAEAYAKSR